MIAEYSGEVASEPRVSYLTTDHLGSPRVTTDERGVVVNRRDFMAFGDEAVSVQRVGGASGNGYDAAGSTRKDYTGYEKDEESGLEFAQARYYNPTHGRFTSVDPLVASATIKNPQTFNRYSYGLNSPYKFTDPLGLLSQYTTPACGNGCPNSGPTSGYSDNFWAFGCGNSDCNADRAPMISGTSNSGDEDDATFAALSALGALCDPNFEAYWPIQVTELSVTYEVSGSSANNAMANAELAGMTSAGRAAETKLSDNVIEIFDARVNTTHDPKTGMYTTQAVIADVIIQATISTTLPTWKERGTASPEERAKWDGYLDQLKGFEAEHTKDTMIRLNQYRNSLLGLRGNGSGSTPGSAEQMAANQINLNYTAAKNTLFVNYNADGKRRDANGGHTIRPY